jgi:hypothetical protein
MKYTDYLASRILQVWDQESAIYGLQAISSKLTGVPHENVCWRTRVQQIPGFQLISQLVKRRKAFSFSVSLQNKRSFVVYVATL